MLELKIGNVTLLHIESVTINLGLRGSRRQGLRSPATRMAADGGLLPVPKLSVQTIIEPPIYFTHEESRLYANGMSLTLILKRRDWAGGDQ